VAVLPPAAGSGMARQTMITQTLHHEPGL